MGDVELNHPAVFVRQGQLLLGEEVIDSDFVGGNVGRRVFQVDLQSAEAAFRHILFDLLQRLLRPGQVESRKPVTFGAVRHISIGLQGIQGRAHVGIQNGIYLFPGKKLQVGLKQIFNGVIPGHHLGP